MEPITKRIRHAMAAGLHRWRGPVGDQLLLLAGLRGGRDITRGNIDGMPYLQTQDPVLLYRGGGNHEIYEKVLQDDRVQSTFQQRRDAVVSCPWEVVPGGNRRQDRAAADFIREQLTLLPWDELTDKMLYAVFYGFSVAEVMWGSDGRFVVPIEIIVRNRRRFVFDLDPDAPRGFSPKLLTTENPDGEPLPHSKFWIFAAGADNDDEPYGRGLAHWLYWPVWFKKNHYQFWLTYEEKFSQPTPMGKYQKHATQAEKEKLLQAVKAVHSDSAIVLPEGMQIELIEASRAGTPEFKAFSEHMDRSITMVVLCQTMTSEDGSSKSQAEVHMSVRREVVAADARLVNDSFNRQVINWLMGWNFPNAAAPKVKRIMDDSVKLERQAKRDHLISQMGYIPRAEYIERIYDIELDPTPRPPSPAGAGRPPATMPPTLDFAEGDPNPLDDLEEVLDAIDEERWEELAAPLILPILRRAKSDPDSITRDLASLYPELDSSSLEKQLARILFIAGIWGSLSEKKKLDDLADALPPAIDPDAPDAPDAVPPGRQPGAAVPPGQPDAVPPGRDPAGAVPPGRQPGAAIPPGQDPDTLAPGRQPDAAIPPGQPGATPPGRDPGAAIPPGQPGATPPAGGGRHPPGRGPIPPGPINLGYAVRLPPRRAIDYFRQKGFAITFNWWEMWEDAHSKAFTVAKATRLDILETIRAALDKALADGQTEAQFIKELQPLLEKAGWWGKQTVVSPDGVEQVVQLGSPRRLQTIYRVNMSTSYAAGRYRQQMENVDSRPYWKYVAVIDERTRHSHAALHNKVFRYDDPIWDTLYPPNGWNCRCIVVALTAEDLKEQNLQVSDSAEGLHEISQEIGTDKTTGEVIHRPGTRYDFIDDAGNPQFMTPDPGWSYNPGKAGPRFVNERRASNRASMALQRETIQYDLNSARFKEAFRKGDVRGWDLAVLPDDVAQALRDRGLKLPGQTVRDGIRPGKLLSEHKKVSVKQYQDLQRVLDQGGVYLQAPGKGGKKFHSLLAEYQDGNGQWWVYAINTKNMRTLTIFDSGPQYRIHKLNQPDITLIKEWDPRQWRKK